MEYITNLAPTRHQLLDDTYPNAVEELKDSSRTMIAHIDSGIASHPSLGYKKGAPHGKPPQNILLDQGHNFYDPKPKDARPISSLKRNPDLLAEYVEHPDHGVKTLSAILGATEDFRGVAPGAKVIPYRVANGALFRRSNMMGPGHPAPTRHIGEAIYHALQYDSVRVINISMGNPGHLGPIFGSIVAAVGGTAGMDEHTAGAINAAYNQGVIIVAAAGQVLRENVYPGVYSRTIAVGGYDFKDGVTNSGSYDHYPSWEYRLPQRVDVWALAERMNRASFDLEASPPVPVYARDHPNSEFFNPSGTSYAAAQVSAVAALWVEKHYKSLENLFSAQRYKIVESFRASLSTSGNTKVLARLSHGQTTRIKKLDIEKVLKKKPKKIEIRRATSAKKQ